MTVADLRVGRLGLLLLETCIFSSFSSLLVGAVTLFEAVAGRLSTVKFVEPVGVGLFSSAASLTGSKMAFCGSSMVMSFMPLLGFRIISLSDMPVCSEVFPCVMLLGSVGL